MKYVVGDFVMSATAWMVYTCVRYWLGGEMMRAQGHTTLWHFLQSPNVITGIIVFPMVMRMMDIKTLLTARMLTWQMVKIILSEC